MKHARPSGVLRREFLTAAGRLAIGLPLAGFARRAGASEAAARKTSPPLAGIWISREELAALPMRGPVWENLRDAAAKPCGKPDVSDQDQMNNVLVLAKALVFARAGGESLRAEVQAQCLAALGTERGGRTLALGRELAAYVIAADLVRLEPAEDARFRAWLRACLDARLQGQTLRSTHEKRPNNWGTHAGASRAAVAAYLDDRAELDRAAQVFRGWVGERAAYAGFDYGRDLSWHADPARPLGVNPRGAARDGHSIDGLIPDDMRRGGGFQFPPKHTGYPWGALEGAVLMAEILHRRGYDAWNWGDQALLRAVQALHRLHELYPAAGWWARGDDMWIPWVVNRACGSAFPTVTPAQPGKNMAWTDWTHAPLSSAR
jgi:hypothetical protein